MESSAYQNLLESLNKIHRMLIRIMMKNDFIDQNYNTADIFRTTKNYNKE